MNEIAKAPNNVGQTVVPLIPQDFDTAWRFAGAIVKGKLAPKGMESTEQVFAAVLMGAEVGLSPMQAMQNIAVVNGRPAIWGDAQLALVESSGLLEDFEETFTGKPDADDYTAFARAKRKDRKTEIVRCYSVADAKKASLWGKSGPWQSNPKRMLQMRARAFTLRDGFADVLKGVYSREELIGEPIDVTPGKTANAAELNSTYLTAPATPAIENQAVATTESPEPQGTQAAGAPLPAEVVTKPTAATIIEQAHAEAEKDYAAKNAAPARERIELGSATPYGTMTADRLVECFHQVMVELDGFDGPDEGVTYLAEINLKGLLYALGRKSLTSEKLALETKVQEMTETRKE